MTWLDDEDEKDGFWGDIMFLHVMIFALVVILALFAFALMGVNHLIEAYL